MRKLPLGAAVLVTAAFAAPALAQGSKAPPMNNFNFAYYTCDNGAAFQITYDSRRPTAATLTTSNNSKQYQLKRMPVAEGAQFSNDKVLFWTNGSDVRINGTEVSLTHCKMKGSAS